MRVRLLLGYDALVRRDETEAVALTRHQALDQPDLALYALAMG